VEHGDILAAVRAWHPLVEFGRPVSEATISAAEVRIQMPFPDELREFLAASDGAWIGVQLDDGVVIHRASPLVWPLDRIVAEHEDPPDDGRPAHVLVLANAGVDGVLFGHPIDALGQPGVDVVVWHPIEDVVTPFAASLRLYLEGWLTGRLTI